MILNKKTLFTFIASISIMGASIILGAPAVSANHDTETEEVASHAAIVAVFDDTTSASLTSKPIFTVDFESIDCNDIIGGNISNAFKTSFGNNRRNFTIVESHINQSLTSHSSSTAESCRYSLVVTSNLNCAFAVYADGDQDVSTTNNRVELASVAKDDRAYSSTSISLIGSDKATEDVDFFVPISSASGLTRELTYTDDVVALGQLAVSASGTNTDIPVTNGISYFEISATECDAPELFANRLVAYNAKSTIADRTATLSILPKSSCVPNSDFGDIDVTTGVDGIRNIDISRDCTYDLSLVKSTDEFSITSLCGTSAIIYSIHNSNTLTKEIKEEEIPLFLTVSASGRFSVTELNGDAVFITFISNDICISLVSSTFGYDVTEGVSDLVGESDLSILIARTENSSEECFASPAAFVIADKDTPTRISLIEREERGRICEYEITYPTVASALELYIEDGGTPATDTTEVIQTGDRMLDGKIIRNSFALQGREIVFTYTQRNLEISVQSTFDTDAVFNIGDLTSYSIKIVGACGRFPDIISRALGTRGEYVSTQAYPGLTLVFNEDLEEYEQDNVINDSNKSLYRIPPVIIINDNIIPCAVEVEELTTPYGCSVVGGSKKILTFSEGLENFDFIFDHVCEGIKRTSSAGRTPVG